MKTTPWEFDFNQVKEHLTTLPDIKEKIKYLLGQKAEYKQAKTWVDWDKSKLPFDKQCELEIKTLKEILQLGGEAIEVKVSTPVADPMEKQGSEHIPIKWTGTPGQLVFLFEQLRDYDLIPASMDLQAAIKKHFVDNAGKTFTTLKQSKQNYLNSKTGKPKRANDLEILVDKVKEKKIE